MKNGKLKERVKGMAMGALLCALVFSGVAVFANPQGVVQRSLNFSGIRVFYNGAEIVATDATGNRLEPFTMDGVTYLPVRAIADALGVLVNWDGATQSVFLGREHANAPSNYLDRISHTNLTLGNTSNFIHSLDGTITDWTGTTYTSGLIFGLNGNNNTNSRIITGDPHRSQIIVDFPLGGRYTEMRGTLTLPRQINSTSMATTNNRNNDNTILANVYFYSAEGLIHSVTDVNMTAPQNFQFNVTGLDNLQIRVSSTGGHWTINDRTLALTDLALFR